MKKGKTHYKLLIDYTSISGAIYHKGFSYMAARPLKEGKVELIHTNGSARAWFSKKEVK